MIYLGRPLFDIRPHFGDNELSLGESTTFERLGFGVETGWINEPHTARILDLEFILSRDQYNVIDDLFKSVRGRTRGFWLPDYAHSLPFYQEPASGDTSILIKNIGFTARFPSRVGFTHAAIMDKDTIIPIVITGVSQLNPEVEEISLQSPLPPLSLYRPILSMLIYARFAEDELVAEFESPSIVRTKIRFTELIQEYAGQELGTRPVYLYKITQSSSSLYLTSYGQDLMALAGQNWAKANIIHSPFERSTEFLDEGLELQIATENYDTVFNTLIAGAPVQKITVEIFQTSAPLFIVDLTKPYYSGDVSSVEYSEHGRINVRLGSIMRVGDWNVPRVLVQTRCNWQLFEPNTCKAIVGLHQCLTTITAITSTYVESPAFATFNSDPNYFALGTIKIFNETRLCIKQDGAKLYINAPFTNGAGVGSTVTARAGCDKARSTCANKFNNLVHYGGFSYIPIRNPQLKALEPPSSGGGGGKK